MATSSLACPRCGAGHYRHQTDVKKATTPYYCSRCRLWGETVALVPASALDMAWRKRMYACDFNTEEMDSRSADYGGPAVTPAEEEETP